MTVAHYDDDVHCDSTQADDQHDCRCAIADVAVGGGCYDGAGVV